MSRFARGPQGIAIVISVMTSAVVFVDSLLRYLTYHAAAYDLGFFDQVVSGVAAGRAWSSSFIPYSFLGQHFEPLLLVPTLLDRLLPSPVWLLGIQAIGLGLAPYAAWRLARVWLGSAGWAPVVFAAVTAGSPLLARTGAALFHPEAITCAVGLFALESAARGRLLRFAALCMLLVVVKEDAGLVAAGCGWIVWRVQHRREGLVVAVGALVAVGVIVAVVMPTLRDQAPSDLVGRYSYLACGAPGVTAVAQPGRLVAGAFAHPACLAAHLFSWRVAAGMATALVPLAILPLASGWAVLSVLPALLVPLLSSDADQSSLLYHYGAEVLPLLIATAILGWRRLRTIGTGSRIPSVALVVATLAGYALLSPLPGGRAFAASSVHGVERRTEVEALLRRVPAGEGVAASTNVVAHLSERAEVFELPSGIGVPWIVVDMRGSVGTQSRDAGYDGVVRSLPGHGYMLVGEAQGVQLWRKP